MGAVWRAHDELVDREVAVKQPHLPGAPEDEAYQRAAHRLHREARAAARVDHPCAVTIHDVVVDDGVPWIVMELVRGESLHERLRRGTLSPVESARIGLAVLGALRAAHAVGIVHRDVKPANVLLGSHSRVVLTDFGVAHVQGEESLTVSGEFVGSLEFVAPERMSGRGAGPASDLWSLGVLLYAAVEGGSPFRRTTLESTLAAILATDPPEPKQAGPLGPLIVGLLVKDPDGRPGPAETAAALETVVEKWPTPGEAGVAQETDGLREFGEDGGTVWLGSGDGVPAGVAGAGVGEHAGGEDAGGEDGSGVAPGEADVVDGGIPQADPGASADAVSPAGAPALPPRGRRGLRHPVALALVGALLGGGIWAGTMAFGGTEGGDGETAVAELTPGSATGPTSGSAAGTSAGLTGAPEGAASPSASAIETWVLHPEGDMDAVLALPVEYEELARQGGPDDQPRLVVYSSGSVDVRLTQWDRAPRDAMGQAKDAHATWAGYDPQARTQYTETSFRGSDAVIADTTYTSEGFTTRVMELMILTGDGRMYELRVDMPKGTAEEQRGTTVFKEARDRLELGAGG
ncbi:serine/threonine-protein kinase [Streptomyces sp. NPDC059477]|uniref:serine/threonine-protein kinase n=1 Tax=Streptomyces sp. NPDC059477 TaxID=3346847 RepID=UPI0036ACF3DA